MNLNKIEFKDLPSEETPLDAATLNTMQDNIEDCILANKGVIEFEGTIESPIDANKIVNVGVYKISGSKENFYNNETETLILEVTLNNTALVQSITTSEGIALRVGQYTNDIWSFGEWDVLTGEKQVGYENEELEGTEKIIIEKSDLGGVDTVELADVVQTLEGNETDKVPSVSAINDALKTQDLTSELIYSSELDYNDRNAKLYRNGNTFNLTGNIMVKNTLTAGQTFLTVPNKYIPEIIRQTFIGDEGTICYGLIEKNGDVKIPRNNDKTWVGFNITWILPE